MRAAEEVSAPNQPLTVQMVTDDLLPKGGYSIRAEVRSGKISLFLDCGSVVNLLARRALPAGAQIITPRDIYVLKAFSGDELVPLGYVREKVLFSNGTATIAMSLVFWVCDDKYFDGDDDGILGTGWFTNFEVRTMFDLMAIKIRGFEFEVFPSNSEPGMWKIVQIGVVGWLVG